MQFSVLFISFLNLFSVAYGCQQWKIGFVSRERACEVDGAGRLRNVCGDLAYRYIQYSLANGVRLGRDITGTTSCDPCDDPNPKCYCRITFWRFREWMGTQVPYLSDNNWLYDKDGDAFGKIPHKNIDCD
ncbi:hypothetical protein MPH_00190 [Macrophomina phaseolina MS6]|uniref:Avirulence Effector AvrLm4-7 domain-containing protein n=2 Tax=Macrophomina phaseolina TaxID=35725 RepID=K2T0N7_MACPH|nr:hypothetical protein MPH_00190 [Macrophomina phaseolina MS6]KAH7015969.1 hypothetical protein B0J12DRAFT_586400 [Macrophomina phaseolina]